MPDISIQFHGLPEELVEFAQELIDDFDLHVVAIHLFPFRATATDRLGLSDALLGHAAVDRLAFNLSEPVMGAKNGTEFLRDNPDSLNIDIGKRTGNCLEQSWLCCRTDNFAAFVTWKEIARRLKVITRTGVVAVNRTTGATAPAKSFRYTEGARALEKSGMTMTEQGGGCLLRFIP